MSRKNALSPAASAPAVPVIETPKPVEAAKPIVIPSPEYHPDVVERQEHLDTLKAKLTVCRQQQKNIEKELGTSADEPDEELEARLLARGLPTDGVTRLRELRRGEGVITKAMALVAAEVKKARTDAKREITVKVRAEVFLPAVREAVKDWLQTVQRIENFRKLVEDIQGREVGSGTYCPFNQAVPITLADREWFKSFITELIREGFTDAETVKTAIPDLL